MLLNLIFWYHLILLLIYIIMCLNTTNLVKIRINGQNMLHVVEGRFGQSATRCRALGELNKVQQSVDSKNKHSHYDNSQPFYQNRAKSVTQAVTQKKVPRTCPTLHSRLATCRDVCIHLYQRKNMVRSSRTFSSCELHLLYNTPSPDFTNPTCIF